MPGTYRVPVGQPRSGTMRQTATRSARPASVPPQMHASRLHSGAASPAESMSSRVRSPINGGVKRKDRDYESDMGEDTNIHVVVRCRGRNEREVRENSGVVVKTEGTRGQAVELSVGSSSLSNKTYQFDKVFSPAADQLMVYEDVVAPILDDMLKGFNCTIFAYGQTGTGKTYTMSGDISETLGLLSDDAGIIPRVLNSLFKKLEEDGSENFVKCSFIELYNEELRDLLSVEENSRLKLFEERTKKGGTVTVVQGMEESHITSSVEGIKLLQDGSYKRQVAATKCNDLSSRSHTVFTITVSVKQATENGSEYVSAGKLNLVDLAGSENIQRSGAENKRAAEAGLINKSLLTLGRVINALVDRSAHIPYRESKLTRLLQDSLGGRTKTCIIATVSPAKSNLEETISTLDYAFSAKNIRNKPQTNPLIPKDKLLRDFTIEIEKLKRELIVTRQKNGVYLANETYEQMTAESESRKTLIDEQNAKIEMMEANLRNKLQELFNVTNCFATLKKDSDATKKTLDQTSDILQKTEIVLADTKKHLSDETVLRRAHEETEKKLSETGAKLISTLNRTVKDVSGLHAKLRRKSDIQALNRSHWSSTQSQVADATQLVESRVLEFQESHKELIDGVYERMQAFVQQEIKNLVEQQSSLQQSTVDFNGLQAEVTEQASVARHEMNEVLEEIKVLREDVKGKVGEGLHGLSAAAGRISAEVISELDSFHGQLHNSYSTLGKDFKNIFEDLLKHLNSQKVEAEGLRTQLTTATAKAVKSDEEVSAKIEACLQEERKQAAKDRQNLLAQITTLINDNGRAEEDRIAAKINGLRTELATTRNELQMAEKKYSDAMDAWSARETALVDQVLGSRDTLKNKLKQDWTTVNERNASIQSATKSVHEETVRIVEAQMKDMATQMQALDDFVCRARTQNETHHNSHVNSLERLGKLVSASQKDADRELLATQGRVEAFAAEAGSQHSKLADDVDPLSDSLSFPLTQLRADITANPITEYSSTGDTPQKVPYKYPTSLPRTQPHDLILSGKASPPGEPIQEESLQDLFDAPASPSKARVFQDASSDQPPPRPSTSDGSHSSGAHSLRELPANLNATVPLSASVSRAISAKALADAAADAKDTKDRAHGGVNPLSRSLMGPPPPLKRQATDEAVAGLGKKVSTRGARARGEGRENVPPVGVPEGGRRRLRSSPRD